MAYQRLFEALQNVCGFIALESDMHDIIDAYEKDKAEINISEQHFPLGDASGSLPDIDYWKQRCLLSEKCLIESPCDQDITSEQMIDEFLKNILTGKKKVDDLSFIRKKIRTFFNKRQLRILHKKLGSPRIYF